MTYKNYKDERWKTDAFSYTVQQRPVTDADFVEGETGLTGGTGIFEAPASNKQAIKVNYVMRREVTDLKLFKTCDGVTFRPTNIKKYRTTAVQECPNGFLPFYNALDKYRAFTVKKEWYLISLNSEYIKDGGVLIRGHWQRYYEWERVKVNAV